MLAYHARLFPNRLIEVALSFQIDHIHSLGEGAQLKRQGECLIHLPSTEH